MIFATGRGRCQKSVYNLCYVKITPMQSDARKHISIMRFFPCAACEQRKCQVIHRPQEAQYLNDRLENHCCGRKGKNSVYYAVSSDLDQSISSL
jgi:hypothetical protein